MSAKRAKSATATRSGPWLVLTRDISESVRVQSEPQLRAGLVLDMVTGMIRGVSVAATEAEAVAQALTIGLTKPAGSLPPGRPNEVLCTKDMKASMGEILSSVFGTSLRPPVRVVDPPAEAEDIFDSFIGHMSGRDQPADPPTPPDWGVFYGHALAFYRAAPWARWHDGVVLALETDLEDAANYAAVVMGNSGVQYGLVLYPGGDVPAGIGDWQPGRPVPTPSGTLALMLDPPSELPADLRNKAQRYGWPTDAELSPVAFRLGPGGGGDPSEWELQLLAVALSAVTAHDARGPVAVGSLHDSTNGQTMLGSGRLARFSVAQKPPPPPADGLELRLHQAGYDLLPDGTPVVLGHLPWESVSTLRSVARIYRPFPSDAPKPSGKDVPLLAILPKPKKGDVIAGKVAELDPYGVTAAPTEDGREVFVLAGSYGAQLLMEVPVGSQSLSDFRRRLRATKGLHVVMVADEATSRGKGTVYGFFECHQPLPKRSRTPNR